MPRTRSTKTKPDSQGAAEGIRTGAAYGRKSDQNCAGLATQFQICRTAAASNRVVIPDEYCFGDDDTTGISTRRPAFDRLVALIETGEAPFAVLYVRNKKRFGRWDDAGLHDYYRIHFQKHGVELRFVDGANPDYSGGMTPETAVQSLQDRMEGIAGSQERTETRKRVITGIRDALDNGFYPGTMAPYGTERWLADKYTKRLIQRVPDGLRISTQDGAYRLIWTDGDQLEAIRLAFHWYEQEECSLEEIARRLHAQGFPPPARPTTRKATRRDLAPARWSGSAVAYILSNPIYAGDLVWGRFRTDETPVPLTKDILDGDGPVICRDFMSDPPISRERFQNVQAIREGKRKNSQDVDEIPYLLSGWILCVHCEGPWFGFTSARTGSGRRRYYRHGGQRGDGGVCPHRNRYIRASEMERFTLDAVLGTVASDLLLTRIEEEIRQTLERLGSLDHQREIERLETSRTREEKDLAELLKERTRATSGTELNAYNRAIADLTDSIETTLRRRQDLEAEMAHADRALQTHITSVARAKDLMAVFELAPLAQRKAILHELTSPTIYNPESRSAEVRIRLPV